MTNPITRLIRRWRYGDEIILVSGLPRSGTSMMMKMLEASGLPLTTDHVREADDDNPKGYFDTATRGLCGGCGNPDLRPPARGDPGRRPG